MVSCCAFWVDYCVVFVHFPYLLFILLDFLGGGLGGGPWPPPGNAPEAKWTALFWIPVNVSFVLRRCSTATNTFTWWLWAIVPSRSVVRRPDTAVVWCRCIEQLIVEHQIMSTSQITRLCYNHQYRVASTANSFTLRSTYMNNSDSNYILRGVLVYVRPPTITTMTFICFSWDSDLTCFINECYEHAWGTEPGFNVKPFAQVSMQLRSIRISAAGATPQACTPVKWSTLTLQSCLIILFQRHSLFLTQFISKTIYTPI